MESLAQELRRVAFGQGIRDAIAASGMTPAQVAERDRMAEIVRLHFWYGDGSHRLGGGLWTPHDPAEPCPICHRGRMLERKDVPPPVPLPIPSRLDYRPPVQPDLFAIAA